MIIINLTHPGMVPHDGDYLEFQYSNGSKVRKHYFKSTPSSPSRTTKMSNTTFWDRFLEEEKEILVDSNNKKIKLFLYDIRIRNTIDLEDNKLNNAINALETAGIIAVGRAMEILEVR